MHYPQQNLIAEGKHPMPENAKRKIFVSYKYHDGNVQAINGNPSTARDYVNEIATMFEGKEICKFEEEGEDLSTLSEDTVADKLHDRIWDSTVMLVLMTPGMREFWKPQKNQWIPREISYALKEITRNGRASLTSAILAIAIPDGLGLYDHAVTESRCHQGKNHRTIHTENFFQIIKDNMFNKNGDNGNRCSCGRTTHMGRHSYIPLIEWKGFAQDYSKYVAEAEKIRENMGEYNLTKELD